MTTLVIVRKNGSIAVRSSPTVSDALQSLLRAIREGEEPDSIVSITFTSTTSYRHEVLHGK